MRWIRKWYYLILLVGTGIVYLSLVDKWQVYARPIAEAKELYAKVFSGQEKRKDDSENGFQDSQGGQPGEGFYIGPQTGEVVEDGASGQEEGNGSGEETETGQMGEGQSGSRIEENGGQPGEGDTPGSEEGSGQGNPGMEPTGQPPADQEPGEPVYQTVEDDYFADAVFIGDSRTVGMYEYGGLEEISTFYATKGLTVYKLFDAEIVPVEGQKKKITVEEALQQNSFAKIYLMIGINEMGTGTVETFVEKYKEVVDHLLELQPDAILYVQGLIKVTTERSQKGDYINNEGIEARNEALAQLADNQRIFYLDVNPLICDENGGMEASYTFDGVHLKAQYIEIWKDFLKTHAIETPMDGQKY